VTDTLPVPRKKKPTTLLLRERHIIPNGKKTAFTKQGKVEDVTTAGREKKF